MKTSRFRAGFTLVELLVVIAIIGILAGLLLPVFSKVTVKAQIRQAQMEMSQLNMAIHSYETDNNQPPCGVNEKNAAANAPGGPEDYTYGADLLQLNGVTLPPFYNSAPPHNNSDVMAILLAKNQYPNANNARNPQGTPYFNPKMVGDTSSPGVGTDLVYRDPWGTPYIITLDFNFDNKTRDVFYRLQTISQASGVTGFNGLNNATDPGGAGDHFDCNSTVMIWSFGPDKKIDPAANANSSFNKDNVLSWKQ